MLNKLTHKAFLEWLKQQPPEQKYDYHDNRECAVGQYARSLGLTYHDLSYLDTVAIQMYPRTFGAAAKRCEEALDNAINLC